MIEIEYLKSIGFEITETHKEIYIELRKDYLILTYWIKDGVYDTNRAIGISFDKVYEDYCVLNRLDFNNFKLFKRKQTIDKIINLDK